MDNIGWTAFDYAKEWKRKTTIELLKNNNGEMGVDVKELETARFLMELMRSLPRSKKVNTAGLQGQGMRKVREGLRTPPYPFF